MDMNPCIFGNGANPVSGSTCQGFTTIKQPNTTQNSLQNSSMLVAENGETIGIYETGSLAGSSSIAYQTTHRSPLSYNIANNKATSMSGLEYSKFEIPVTNQSSKSTAATSINKPQHLSSKTVVDNHEIASSSFFKSDIDKDNDVREEDNDSLYDTLLEKLSKILNNDTSSSKKDDSKIEGGVLVEVYYVSIAFIMLYFVYKLNHTSINH